MVGYLRDTYGYENFFLLGKANQEWRTPQAYQNDVRAVFALFEIHLHGHSQLEDSEQHQLTMRRLEGLPKTNDQQLGKRT